MKNVLVTGGAGYIGSHTCKELSRAGYSPIVYDDFSQGHPWAVRYGPVVKGDLADDKLSGTFETEGLSGTWTAVRKK